MKKSLTKPAQKIIEQYLNLEIADTDISCPYFNNRKQKVRSGLKVEIGKGSPKQIQEEAKRIGKREGIDLNKLSAEELRKLLIDNNIGIDCSGLAYYILDTEAKEKNKGSLQRQLNFSNKSFIRKIISKFRTVENIGVELLAHENNSKQVSISEVQPGDFLAMKEYGPQQNKNHISVIQSVEYEKNEPQKLHCIHSFQWSSDGEYGGGVRRWKLDIEDPGDSLIEQTWIEKGQKNEDNETYKAAQDATELKLKRLRVFEGK